MSLVIAVKEEGRVLFGADTQTTFGDLKWFSTAGSELKVARMPNGILIGNTGTLNVTNTLVLHPEWFDPIPEEGITKRFLVTEIIPKLIRKLKEKNALDKSAFPEVKMDGTFLIGQKDRLFYISRAFAVFEIPHYAAIGCGSFAAEAVFSDEEDDRSVCEKIVSALKLAAQFDVGVGMPALLIDTAGLEYTVVEDEK